MLRTSNVLEAAYRHGGKERIIGFSTSEIFGSGFKVDRRPRHGCG